LGLTNTQIAGVIGIAPRTLIKWGQDHPEFYAELERGRMHTDALVAESFLKCCLGFEYYTEEIVSFKGQNRKIRVKKYVPPSATACQKWLQTRRREYWGVTQQIDITQRTVDLSDVSTEELKMLERIGVYAKDAIERN